MIEGLPCNTSECHAAQKLFCLGFEPALEGRRGGRDKQEEQEEHHLSAETRVYQTLDQKCIYLLLNISVVANSLFKKCTHTLSNFVICRL